MGSIYELLQGALRSAQEQVDLMTPYFIPDSAILMALRTASRSGIRVRLLLPHKTDHRFMHWAARAYLKDLIERGVEVWEISAGFVHSKLAVVDSTWVLLGSSNLDPRSFRLNFEFNVEAYSRDLAAEVLEYIEGYRANASRVTLKSLEREALVIKLRNQAFKLFSPFL